MELLFGNRVRSGARRAGYLAGVEVDPASRRVTKIIFSEDGKLGSHAQTRAIEAVRSEHGTIVVGDATSSSVPAPGERAIWSRVTRVTRDGRPAGHLTGVVVGGQGVVESVLGRSHWWTPRYRVAAADSDWSFPGEIRVKSAGVKAA